MVSPLEMQPSWYQNACNPSRNDKDVETRRDRRENEIDEIVLMHIYGCSRSPTSCSSNLACLSFASICRSQFVGLFLEDKKLNPSQKQRNKRERKGKNIQRRHDGQSGQTKKKHPSISARLYKWAHCIMYHYAHHRMRDNEPTSHHHYNHLRPPDVIE